MNSIVSILERHAASRPDAIAVIDYGRVIKYGALYDRVLAAAAWMHEIGVRPGDIVALSLETSPESSLRYLQFFYAAAYLGTVILPIYPGVPIPSRIERVTRFRAG
jgi:acyl-CoA synthetase (AMP-forming)/AMP-acid ligase II